MSFQLNMPPSVVAKMVKNEEIEVEDEPKKKSREDWRKLKELEEARKAGTAPAMKDEEGKDINPHIPQYIMQAPWYFGATTATLRHQRPQDEDKKQFTNMDEWFKRGVKEGPVATKYRKGACANCGAMTHAKKDCLERPRKIGAKYTGDMIAPDEYIQPQLDFDYDGKRDRWNGFDPNEHQKVIDDYAKIEEAKMLLKEQRLEQSLLTGDVEEIQEKADDNSEDDEKYADNVDMPGQKFETKQRITVRNLRIREDTAKYLFNLDPNSAFYDAKTRSMRENPYKNSGKDPAELTYAGDNFVRQSGDADEFARKQLFAWEAYEKGADVHLQSDPTKLELLNKEVVKRKDDFKTGQKDSILEKYGGKEHLDAPPKQLLLAQTEDYVEYSRHGSVLKGQEKAVVRSKYEEDVYVNNHTCIWGSYWMDGHWGYKCCYSLIKESYCTGESGREAAQLSVMPLHDDQEEFKRPKSLLQRHQENLSDISTQSKKKKKKRKNKKKKHKKRSSSSEESDTDSDDEDKIKERKLKKALQKEAEHQRRADELLAMDERKRPYNSMYDVQAPSEEDIEAWKLKRQRFEDPMTHFSNS